MATWLTGALLLSNAWLAPWVFQLLAEVPTRDHAATRKHLALSLKHHAEAAGIRSPKLVFIDHPRTIAFGVGMPAYAAVFVTTGLTERLTPEALDFAIAHEIAHISQRHSLFQSLVFAGLFVGRSVIGYPLALLPLVLLGYLAFLRRCEYAADSGAARVVGRSRARQSLQELASMVGDARPHRWWFQLLSTHPSFQRRIAAC